MGEDICDYLIFSDELHTVVSEFILALKRKFL